MSNGICPTSGNPCNKPPCFIITEQLGDKAQSTSCCRDCAAYHVAQRNTLAAQRELESQAGVQVISGSDFVSKIFGFAGKEPPSREGKIKTCPTCNSNFEQILESNRIGCQDCYKVFQEELKPYLAGRSPHSGKTPIAVKIANLPEPEKLKVLETALNKAVEVEDYEQAARFRDMINKIKDS
jgi:protein arginine kinase activator